MLEVEVHVSADALLEDCRRRGLVIRSERPLGGRPGGRHWHLGYPGRAGTLELSESPGRVWLKVHPLRDGGWASELARDLASVS